MNLIQDSNFKDRLKVINESKSGNGLMKVSGIFGRADTYNNNNRRYSKAILEREITKLSPLLSERRLLGELDHPEYTSVKLSNVSHIITKLGWKGNELIGEAEILNTPAGKVVQQLLKDGVSVGISSRGLGSLKEAKDDPTKFEVSEDYKMVTFDLVADPSTKGAFPTLTESVDLLAKTKKMALQEQIFLNMLENKIADIRVQDNEVVVDSGPSEADLLCLKIDEILKESKITDTTPIDAITKYPKYPHDPGFERGRYTFVQKLISDKKLKNAKKVKKLKLK